MEGIKGRGQYFSMMVLRTSTGKGGGGPVGDEEVARYLEFLWVG